MIKDYTLKSDSCFYYGQFCYRSHGPDRPCDACTGKGKGICSRDLTGVVPFRYKQAHGLINKRRGRRAKQHVSHQSDEVTEARSTNKNDAESMAGTLVESINDSQTPYHNGINRPTMVARERSRVDQEPHREMQERSSEDEAYDASLVEKLLSAYRVTEEGHEARRDNAAECRNDTEDIGLRLLRLYKQDPPMGNHDFGEWNVSAEPCRRCLKQRRVCLTRPNTRRCRNCMVSQHKSCSNNLNGAQPNVRVWKNWLPVRWEVDDNHEMLPEVLSLSSDHESACPTQRNTNAAVAADESMN